MYDKGKATQNNLKDINEDDLKKISDEDYNSNEKKMDLVMLHNVSEQRCKSYGCSLNRCITKTKDMNKCQDIFRELNRCVEKERKKIIYEFIVTNKQLKY